MSIWQEHAKRVERQEKLRRLSAWLEAHPYQAAAWTLGISILILEVALYLRFALDAIARWIGGV